MSTLFINACVRPNSRTKQLADCVLSKLNDEVVEIKLAEENILPLDLKTLEKRLTYIEKQDYSDNMFRFAKQFAQAETIVIAAPYWDLSFPAMLKNYIENVNVLGITFAYSPEGKLISLCNAKKIIYTTTSGGPIFNDETGYGYIKTLANVLYNIGKIYYFKAEKLDMMPSEVEAILAKAKDEINNCDFS